MKGGGKRNVSEALNEFHADVNGNNGNRPAVAPFVEIEHTPLQKVNREETHLQDSDGEGVGAEDEVDDNEDEDEDEEKEDGGGVVADEAQGPKLDDGFYEIEAIRRKRVRKGELQYLIKWRGWPDAANTWEPLENLQAVPDVIDAFEESLRSGKHRKRKRKHVVYSTQPKKRLERSTTSYSLRQFTASGADNHPQSAPPVNDLRLSDIPAFPQAVLFADEGENNSDVTNQGKDKQSSENGPGNASKQIAERREENDYDPKLSELKAANGVDAVHSREGKTSGSNGPVESQPRVDNIEQVNGGRCRGAKRRKSGSVKRFQKESNVCDPVDTQNAIMMSGGGIDPTWIGSADFGVNSSQRNKADEARKACNIVKIIKPIGYSASISNSMQDVSVTFMAVRSDGSEVMVDNKYLKAYNPLLLINFYEQHLRYSPIP